MNNSVRRKRKNNFTMISNDVAEDSRMSWKAKGIFMYLWSKIGLEDWTYNMADIVNQSKDKRDATLAGIKELELLGYVERIPNKASGTKFSGYIYLLDDTPSLGDSVHEGFPATVFPVTGNPPLSNTEYNNTDFIVTDKSDDAIPAIKEVSETMKDAIAVATLLADSLRDSIGNFKYPTEAGLMKWAKDIDLAIRLDKRTLNGLKNIIG